MSLLKSISQQLGLSSTATQNFTLTAAAADGTLKLARGNAGATTQDILTVDANGVVASVQGIRGGLFSGTAQNTTSGTSINFTGIPSWAKRITIMFNGVSTNGVSSVQVQIGSGSITTTGYTSGASFVTASVGSTSSTSGFVIQGGSATNIRTVLMTLVNISGNVWVSSHSGCLEDQAGTLLGGGKITLAGTLDRLRLTSANGTDVFDAGSVNILYEG